MKKVLFLVMFCLPLMAQITKTPQGISSLDSTWSSIRVDQIFSTDGGDVLMDQLTVDTVIVNKYIEEKHTALYDSLTQWSRDGDIITMDASKNANFLEMKDEGVTVFKVDSAGNTTIGASAQGANLTVRPGYSVDLLIANPISGWGVVTGWTNATGTHAATNTGSLVANFNVVSGTSYELNYTITQTTAGGGITPSCGGFTMPNVQAAGSYTYNFRATATTALTFAVPSGTWQGSITACTLTTPSNGNVTAFGLTLSAPLSSYLGSNTYPSISSKVYTNTGLYFSSTGYLRFSSLGTYMAQISTDGVWLTPSTSYYGWRQGNTLLYSDASNQLDMRNGTAAQRLNVFNTYTGATNNEYGSFNATASALDISTQHGSAGGSARPITFTVGGAISHIMTPGGKFAVGTVSDTTSKMTVAGSLNVGAFNTTAGIYASALGTACAATGNYSSAFGVYAISGSIAEQSLAAFKIAASGDAQSSVVMVGDTSRFLTTNELLHNDGVSGSTSIGIAVNSCNYFEAMVVGKVIAGTDIGKSVAYKITGVIDRGASNVAMYGLSVTVVYEHADIAASCDATAVANNTAKTLDITATHAHGDHTNEMYWLARVTMVHIGG
jgi:hypothetical protein